MKTTPKKNGGFTLVELIVVIAILAILAAVAIPAYSGYIEKAEKANDLQLLGAVNTAFNAACMAEGIDVSTLTASTAQMPIGSDGKVVITSIKPASVQDEFEMFFEGNEDTAFEVIKSLTFSNGAFAEADTLLSDIFNAIISNPAYADSIAALKGSAFAGIGTDALLGQVGDVTGIAAALMQYVGEDGEMSALTAIVMGNDDYRKSVATMLYPDLTAEEADAAYQKMLLAMEDPADQAAFLANTTILNVAGTVNSWSSDEEIAMKNALIGLDYSAMVKKVTDESTAEEGLAQAALLYGMYTSFDPEGAQTLLNGEEGMLASMKNIGEKTNASGQTFADYLAGLNTEGSQAYLDFAGYKGALDVVNGAVTESPDAAMDVMTNGFENNDDLAAMLGQILGG